MPNLTRDVNGLQKSMDPKFTPDSGYNYSRNIIIYSENTNKVWLGHYEINWLYSIIQLLQLIDMDSDRYDSTPQL